ncbi:MAG: PIN domain-containing protein [Ancrocorticia sp.]|uniref:PIN domain-containing protein n=1 Tax=Ancrocorticia sp. TaxID=2593684 RepID=UPI003F8E1D48
MDTNVLVYAFDTSVSSATKRARSPDILNDDSRDLVVSPQVLGEFYVTVTRNLATPLGAQQAAEVVNNLGNLRMAPLDYDLVCEAIETVHSAQLSYWDSLIVCAAKRARCSRVLTEDLNTGAPILGARVENPYQ